MSDKDKNQLPGNDGSEEKKKSPGPGMGVGMVIGMGAGIAIGVAVGNIAVGVAIGAGIGIPLGAGIDAKNKEGGEYTPTPAQKKLMVGLIIGGAALLGLLIFLYFFVLKS